MKSLFYSALCCLFLLGMYSCSDDDTIAGGIVKIEVEYPDTYSQSYDRSNIEVKLISETNTGNERTLATDVNGLVTFEDVTPGTYNVSIALNLNVDKAEELTGHAEDLVMNATENGLNVVSEQTLEKVVILAAQPLGDLVIKQTYFNETSDRYFDDEFVEIYNNSDHVIYADGLMIGSYHPKNVDMFDNDTENAYFGCIWQLPGSGEEYPIQPGESIIIAEDARDHTVENQNSFDLSGADFETYVDGYDDLDNGLVPDVKLLRNTFVGNSSYLSGMYSELQAKLALCIFRCDDFSSLTVMTAEEAQVKGSYQFTKVPIENIIDGYIVSDSYWAPKLPAKVDAGMMDNSEKLEGHSFIRKVATVINDRKILQDSDNSSNDFVIVNGPVPGNWNE
ncbi:DUF4876 domain-containing protein [Puteibacter caeruleilacunae]|nr:DUF4876 domain-containing protein [Puteibacter caeruleilacunae]